MKAIIVLTCLFAYANAGSGVVTTYNTGVPAAFGVHAAYNPLGLHGLGYHSVAYGTGAVAYKAAPSSVTYNSPAAAVTYSAPAVAAPVTYSVPAGVAPVTYSAPVATAVSVPAFTKTQYHAQDVLGQASYGYSYPGQAHSAVRDAAGNVRGAYAYINPDGNEIRVNYVADHGGFRAESNALPQAPVHVVAGQTLAPAVPVAIAPAQVVADTPEVIEARRAHLVAHQEARARNLVLRKKRGIFAAATPVVAYSTAYPSTTALTYNSVHHPVAYSTYSSIHHPTAYSAVHHPTPYSAVHHPLTYTTAAVVPAATTLTQVVNNTPGHAVSYRVF